MPCERPARFTPDLGATMKRNTKGEQRQSVTVWLARQPVGTIKHNIAMLRIANRADELGMYLAPDESFSAVNARIARIEALEAK